MLTSSSSSPSLHAKSPRYPATTSYHSPRLRASAPPLTASASSSSSSSSRKIASASQPSPSQPIHVPSSTTHHVQQPLYKSADAGTQYSPPDWPPTSSRSSLRRRPNPSLTVTSPAARGPSSSPGAQQRPVVPEPPRTVAPNDAVDGSSPLPAPPPEPHLRVNPTASLENAIRRPLSAESSTDTSATNISTDSKKRARLGDSAAAAAKVLPADYSDCPPKTLAHIIASMLMRLIAHNDSIPLRDGQLTRFHSRSPPGISVHDYLARLTFHGTLSPPILLSMVFFIDRLSSNYAKFIINSLTVHRFLITAATAASKGLSDSFWTNHVYARVGGVSVKELALLELELLIQCDWKIVPKPEDLVEYYRGLVRQSDEYLLEGDDGADGAADVLSSTSGGESTDAGTTKNGTAGAGAMQTEDDADEGDPMDTSGENT